MGDCTTQCKATKVLIFGIILILVRTITSWDIWVVLGILLVIKGIILFKMPMCACQKKKK